MLSSQNSNIRRELCMLLSSRTQWTHIMRLTCEILNNCYQALVPGFVSSAGTAPGVKQLIFPGVDFSPSMVYKQHCIYKRNMLCTLDLHKCIILNCLCICPNGPRQLSQCTPHMGHIGTLYQYAYQLMTLQHKCSLFAYFRWQNV